MYHHSVKKKENIHLLVGLTIHQQQTTRCCCCCKLCTCFAQLKIWDKKINLVGNSPDNTFPVLLVIGQDEKKTRSTRTFPIWSNISLRRFDVAS